MTKQEEENQKTSWKPTDSRFVAFLDILGFKDLVMRSSHEDIYKLLSNISNFKKDIEKTNTKLNSKNNMFDVEIYVVSFSDSIVLFSKNDSKQNFIYFIYSVNWLFAKSIENSIPLKGGIAYGKISLNKTNQVYFGQPIIDAYLLEEEVNYFGIVAHNSIDKYIYETPITDMEDLLLNVETPLKCGKIHHTNLNWFSMMKMENEQIINCLKKFYTTVSGSSRKYVDNTLSFFRDANDNTKIVH